MNMHVQLISMIVVGLSVTGVALSRDAIGPGDKDSRWIVGGGAFTATNIYAGEDSESEFLPRVVFNGERLFVKDGLINYSINEWDQVSAGVTVSLAPGFLSDSDEYRSNPELAGLEERDEAVEGGFYVYHTTDMGRMRFSFLSDISNEHDGHTADLNYTFDLKSGDWYINPMVGLNWISSDKVDHLFGVSSAEETATRLSYEGDSTVNVYTGVRGRYEFSNNWDVNLQAGVTHNGSGISDSSIVDEDKSYYGAATFNYSF